MKFLGIIAFFLALKWTWSLAMSEPTVDIKTHQQIQQELRGIITQVIAQLRPSATEIKFNTIWTEPITDDKLKAHFSYTFKDQGEDGQEVEQSEDGYGVLNRIPDPEDPTENSWSLDEVTVSQEVIDFKKNFVISPEKKE